MAQQLTTAVDPDDLTNLGTQCDNAAVALRNTLGDPSRFTAISPDDFGPAPDVLASYIALANQFSATLSAGVTNLHVTGQFLRTTAGQYRQLDAANQARIGGH